MFCVDHLLNPTTQQCDACPTGAYCGDNVIQGNEAGYWESPDSNFYPCTLSVNPSNDDIQASRDACPQAAESQFQCGTGYSGPRCLNCVHNYGIFESKTGLNIFNLLGNDGPYCKQCPNQGINWVVVLVCTVTTFLLAIFIIYHGKNKDSKEAISIRIFLTHAQMLAIISGTKKNCSTKNSNPHSFESSLVNLDRAFPKLFEYWSNGFVDSKQHFVL